MKRIICLLVICGLASVAMADNIVVYDFEGDGSGTTAPASVAAGASATDVTSGPSAGGYWDVSDWMSSGDFKLFNQNPQASQSLSDALSVGSYAEFTITGPDLDLDTLCFGVGTGGSDTRYYAIRWSLDGFASDLANGSTDNGTATLDPVSVDVSAAQDQTSVTFRSYVWYPGNRENRGHRLDNIVVTGTVPEPATMSLLALGGLAALVRRRK